MIYLDNGATSYPKPAGVYEAVENFMRYCGASAGRSAHKKAEEAMEIAAGCRFELARFISAENPEDIVFVKNATEGLNIIIRGMVKKGDKVTVSPMEHNSVMRPLYAAEAQVNFLPLTEDGRTDVEQLAGIDEDTELVVINHVSNVSGAVNDIYRAAQLCRQMGIPLLVDCSQSAGHFLIDVKKLAASVVFPGHKGMLGPQGTGVMYLHGIRPKALCFGGTGSDSENMMQPLTMPDYYESGTLNMLGISGLLKSVEYINSRGLSAIHEKETQLCGMLREGLGNMKRVKLVCPKLSEFGPVVSFSADRAQTSEISFLLDEKYDIAVRSGLHCAPSAHRAYGTLKGGTVRLSPGIFNTHREISLTLDAINNILNHGVN